MSLDQSGAPERNVVSFSLYGALPLYTEGALRNAELVHTIYPGWSARFYVDDSVPKGTLAGLRERGAEIVETEKNLGPVFGRYWRFSVAADPSVSRFIVRDCDSRLNVREKAAVDEWIASGRAFHVMRDSSAHNREMLSGMWGGKGGALPDIDAMIARHGRFDAQGQNDEFLSKHVFPIIRHDCLCHDSWGHHPGYRPFPPHPPLTGTSSVGEIVTPEMDTLDVWRERGELLSRVSALATENAAMRGRLLRLDRTGLARRARHDLSARWKSTAAVGEFFVRLDERFEEPGWHPAERQPAVGTFRWSGPGEVSALPLPRPLVRPGTLSLTLVNAMPGALEGLELLLGDASLAVATREAEDGTTRIETRLAPGPAGRLLLLVPNAARPCDVLGTGDKRRLGIAVQLVRFTEEREE